MLVQSVLEKNSKEVQRYKSGEKKLFSFLVGQVMKISKGQANPKKVNKTLREFLE